MLVSPSPATPTYLVQVDSNAHYQEAGERYTLGTFATCAAATAACQSLLDRFLTAHHQPNMTADHLWQCYVAFGEDPFIVTADPACRFSAWTYVRHRCRTFTGESNGSGVVRIPLREGLGLLRPQTGNDNPQPRIEFGSGVGWLGNFAKRCCQMR